MKEALLIIIIILVVLYLGAGVVMALFEQSQTDNPFNWLTLITWLPKIFK